MNVEDLAIRPARPDEAEALSHLMFLARADWEYPRELIEHWIVSGGLTITPDEIENDAAYVAEDEEEAELIGFYSLRFQDGEAQLRELCVLPEHVGEGVRTSLFLHACELAETSGAESVTIVAHPHAERFYEEMGAERVGEVACPAPLGMPALPVLRMNL